MKRVASLLLSCAIVFGLSACSNFAVSERQEEPQGPPDAWSEEAQDTTRETEKQSAVPQHAEQESEEQEKEMGTRALVAYFSCTGTTKPLAEYAAETLQADLYEIVAEDPYTEEDLAYYTGGRADKEQDDPDSRPAISGSVENMDSYDIVVIGFPLWHGQAPRIISTFLESYDFSGKTIVPFCTSHSSGIGSATTNLQGLCSDSARWMDGRRFEGGTSRETIEEWIGSLLQD